MVITETPGKLNSSFRISLIIPAYNEEAYLPRLLESVRIALDNYKHGPEQVEVIVSDNCSTDNTVRIARDWGCLVVREEKRVIAAVRNAGARVSQGQFLAFIDADSVIHSQTFNAIDEALSSGRLVAGATGVNLERLSPGIALTLVFFLPAVWLTGMDSGVVFCRREDFLAIGGYDESRPYAEDVNFLWRMRKLGKRTSRKLCRASAAKATTSTRKFDKHGDWHYFRVMLRGLYGMFFSKRSAWKLAREYWYVDKR